MPERPGVVSPDVATVFLLSHLQQKHRPTFNFHVIFLRAQHRTLRRILAGLEFQVRDPNYTLSVPGDRWPGAALLLGLGTRRLCGVRRA